MLMYNDLFVAPKQKELQKLKRFIPATALSQDESGIKAGAIRATEDAIKKPIPKLDRDQVI